MFLFIPKWLTFIIILQIIDNIVYCNNADPESSIKLQDFAETADPWKLQGGTGSFSRKLHQVRSSDFQEPRQLIKNRVINIKRNKFGPYCIPRSVKKKENEILPYCVLSPEKVISGRKRHGSIVHRTPFPPWMNLELARRGQEFAVKYRYSVTTSALVGLLTGLAFPDAKDAIFFTSNSDTPLKSLKRYTATVTQLFVWIDEVLITDTHNNIVLKSLTNVRGLHTIAATKANSMKSELNPVDNYKDVTTDDEMWEALVADLSTPNNLKYLQDFLVNYTSTNSEAVYINQFIQGLTIAGFIGYTVMYPETLFIYDATDDDLEAYMHLFAIVGYCLGVEDDYNMAIQPNAKAAKVYYKEMVDKYIVPAMLQVDKKAKILIESFVNGFFLNGTLPGQTSHTIMLRVIRDFLKVDTSHMTGILDTDDAAAEEYWDNYVTTITKLPGIRLKLNNIIRTSVETDILVYFGPYTTNKARAEHVYYKNGL